MALAVELAAGDAEPIVEVAVFGGGSGGRPHHLRPPGAGPGARPPARRGPGGDRGAHAAPPGRPPARRGPGGPRAHPRGPGRAPALRWAPSIAAGRARAGAAVRPVLVREEAVSLDALRALRIQGPRGESVLGDVADVVARRVPDGDLLPPRRRGRRPGAGLPRPGGERRGPRRAGCASGRPSSRRGPAPGCASQVVADRSAEVVAALRELGLAALTASFWGSPCCASCSAAGGRRWRSGAGGARLDARHLLRLLSLGRAAGRGLARRPRPRRRHAGGQLDRGAGVDRDRPRPGESQSPRSRAPARSPCRWWRASSTTAVVFLPLIYLKGLARAFFGAQAFAIVASLAASLLFSLTVTPVLARGPAGGAAAARGGAPGAALYLRLLDGTPRPAGRRDAGGCRDRGRALLALALLPRELVPDGPARDLVVRYRLSPDLTPEAARRLGGEVEARAAQALGRASAAALAVQLPRQEPGRGTARRPGGSSSASPTPKRRPGPGPLARGARPPPGRRGLGGAADERLRASRSSGRAGAWRWWPPPPPRSAPRASPAGWRTACANGPACARPAAAATAPRPPCSSPGTCPAWPPWAADRGRPGAAGARGAGGPDRRPRPHRRASSPRSWCAPPSRRTRPCCRSRRATAGRRPARRPGPAGRRRAPARPRAGGRPARRAAGLRRGPEASRVDPDALSPASPGRRTSRSPPAARPWSCAGPSASSGSPSSSRSSSSSSPSRPSTSRSTTPLVVMTTVPVALGGALGLLAARRADAQRPVLPGPDPARRHRGQQRHRARPPDRGPPAGRRARWTRPSAAPAPSATGRS